MVKDKLKKPEYSKNISELARVCKIAFDKGLIDTHSGNIGMGINKNVLITKTGRSLIDLKPCDFTISPFNLENRDCRNDLVRSSASSELEVHKFILKSFPDSTVFHSHPLNAITLSLNLHKINNNINNNGGTRKELGKFKSVPLVIKRLHAKYPELNKISPLDFESAYFFPEIYVFPPQFIADIKTGNLGFKFKAKDIFKENGVFMIKSHGSFSWGKTPLDALRWTMTLEASSEIILKCLSL